VKLGYKGAGQIMSTTPLGMAAYDALIIGKRQWVLIPYTTDEAERSILTRVTSAEPQEWWQSVFPELQEKNIKHYVITQEAGDIVYIPENHYFAFINLKNSVSYSEAVLFQDNIPTVFQNVCKYSEHTVKPATTWCKALFGQSQNDFIQTCCVDFVADPRSAPATSSMLDLNINFCKPF